jgi:LacI family transcriptional regulator
MMESQDNLSIVSIDNYVGGRMAMSHLLEQGYRKIGYISGPLDWRKACQQKTAWNDALTDAGVQVEAKHWVEGNWSSESGARAFEILFEQYPEMDSIFVGNDQMALGVIQIARQKGLKIPEDIGLVGFDDIPESAYFWPPLTTVQQDQYSLAKLAVEKIVKTIESIWDGTELAEPTNTTILSPTLVVRKSSLRCKEALPLQAENVVSKTVITV